MLKNLVVPCEINPLPAHEVEIDEFGVRYTANERPNIQNDTITLNYRTSGVIPGCCLVVASVRTVKLAVPRP